MTVTTRKKTVLITGGAGYIGSHVNKKLNALGWNTIVFDNLVYGHRDAVKWGEFIKGDLSNRQELREIFRSRKIDAVMHFAAYTYVGESVSDPGKYYINNVSNALNLLEAIREGGVRYFVFSSTCAVYGDPVSIPITEDHPTKPVNPYGRTKRIIEEILADYAAAYGLNYIALRYFNAAGADPEGETGENHNPETHLIPLIFDAALALRPHIKIFGTDYDTKDGSCIRDYIHVQDLAEAHILSLQYLMGEGESGAFNLGNGEGYSVKEIIACAEKVTGLKIPAVEAPRREGDPAILIGSSEKAKNVLGWRPEYYKIEDIISTAWKWHQRLRSR